MPEMINISKEKLSRIEERARKLAMEKSYLQLVIQLINKVSASSGLENTVDCLLRNILEVIGGTNIILYYWIDEDIFSADVFGRKMRLDSIEDEIVQQVLSGREPVEIERPFSDTKMLTPAFSSAYTWVFPLLVGPELIGVFKMENLHIAMRDLYQKLPAFFNFTALILKNEILGYTKLKKACDQLSKANEELTNEVEVRKQAEEALTQEREFTRALLESMADGVVACDAEGTLTLFNRAAREWHGLDPMKLPPEEWAKHYDLYRPDGITPLPTEEIPLARAFRGQTVVDAGMAIVAKARPARFILANGGVIRDKGGNKLGAVVVMRDITELRRFEEELCRTNEELEKRVAERTAELRRANELLHVELGERRRAEEKANQLAAIVQSSEDAVIGKTLDGIIMSWNRGAEKIYGYAANEMIGKPIGVLTLPGREDEVPRILDKIRSGEHIDHYEAQRRRKDGREILMSLTISPVRDAESNIVAASAIGRDITERKRAEEEIRRLNAELEQRVRERTAELEAKKNELEKMNRLFVGRELRMIELKKKIRELEEGEVNSG